MRYYYFSVRDNGFISIRGRYNTTTNKSSHALFVEYCNIKSIPLLPHETLVTEDEAKIIEIMIQ